MAWRIICESSELAIECAHAAQTIGLSVDPQITSNWVKDSQHELSQNRSFAIVLVEAPAIDDLVEMSYHARSKKLHLAVAVLSCSAQAKKTLQACYDLGITALSEVQPLISAIALIEASVPSPWTASLKLLSSADKVRLRPTLVLGGPVSGRLLHVESGIIAWAADSTSPRILIGAARDTAAAITALRLTDRSTSQVVSSVEDVDDQAVLDVIFGPPRSLSDPASKAALQPYGIATPVEELCASASRTVAEANRIGYPVRIALASPDLRVWDHPDLAVDTVYTASRCREVFGQLMSLAKSRAPESRVLGVTVAAANAAAALLHIRAKPLPHGKVSMEIGFSDPHGKVSQDETITILPASISNIQRAINRLQGRDLLLSGSRVQQKENLESIADTLLRIAAFLNDRRNEVDSVEILPLALLIGGGFEVREACISVNDAFQRSMETYPEDLAINS